MFTKPNSFPSVSSPTSSHCVGDSVAVGDVQKQRRKRVGCFFLQSLTVFFFSHAGEYPVALGVQTQSRGPPYARRGSGDQDGLFCLRHDVFPATERLIRVTSGDHQTSGMSL